MAAALTETGPRDAPAPSLTPAPPRLVIRPRRGLPSGRAVLGGVLVALAVVATFVVAGGGDREAGVPYVVVARAVDAGTPLGPDDLALRRLQLDHVVADGAFTDPAAVLGRRTLAPLEPGDLVQASAVAEGPDVDVSRLELTLAVPGDRVPPGLRRGEAVTLLATVGSGAAATTSPVLDAVEVVDVTRGDGVADRGQAVLTLALDHPDDATAAAHAARVGELTVVRLQGEPAPFTPAAAEAATTTTAAAATGEELGG